MRWRPVGFISYPISKAASALRSAAALQTAFTRVTELAEKHGLSVYDATYLELALRERVPLATNDASLRQAATKAGVPVIVSIAYKKGQLDNSPIPSTSGHLLVVRGFDAAGNVLTNDPAASSDEGVGITYDRLQFEHAWLDNSNGTAYLIYPQGWTVPSTNGHW